MKRKIALLLACLLIAATATGCISSKKDTDNAQSAASDNSSASSPADESGSTNSAAETAEGSDASNDGGASSTDTSSKDTSSKDASSKTENSDKTSDTEKNSVVETDTSGVTVDDDGNIIIDIDEISEWKEDTDDSEDSADEPDDPEENNGRKPMFNDMSYQMIYLAPGGFTDGSALPTYAVITSAKELQDFINTNKTAYSLDIEHTDDNYITKMSFVNETSHMNDDFFNGTEVLVTVAAYKKGTECDIGDIYTTGQCQ